MTGKTGNPLIDKFPPEIVTALRKTSPTGAFTMAMHDAALLIVMYIEERIPANPNPVCTEHHSCYQQGVHDGFEECRKLMQQELQQ